MSRAPSQIHSFITAGVYICTQFPFSLDEDEMPSSLQCMFLDPGSKSVYLEGTAKLMEIQLTLWSLGANMPFRVRFRGKTISKPRFSWFVKEEHYSHYSQPLTVKHVQMAPVLLLKAQPCFKRLFRVKYMLSCILSWCYLYLVSSVVFPVLTLPSIFWFLCFA